MYIETQNNDFFLYKQSHNLMEYNKQKKLLLKKYYKGNDDLLHYKIYNISKIFFIFDTVGWK